MTAKEAVNWIINIMADIGKSEYRALWHYEQALMEIREMLETSAQPEPIKLHVDHALTEEEIKNLKHKIADSPIVLMPSVQIEPLTDKEQRIFLAAMGREEKVCKQVDEECRDCREPYEDSLVRTCHEIIRKVKGALWT